MTEYCKSLDHLLGLGGTAMVGFPAAVQLKEWFGDGFTMRHVVELHSLVMSLPSIRFISFSDPETAIRTYMQDEEDETLGLLGFSPARSRVLQVRRRQRTYYCINHAIHVFMHCS